MKFLLIGTLIVLFIACVDQHEEKTMISPGVRNAHSMVFNSKTKEIILFAGATDSLVKNDLWYYNKSGWHQKDILTDEPIERTFAAMTYDSDNNRIIMFGGNKVLFGSEADSSNLLGDTWILTENNWQKINTLHSPPPRAESSLAYDMNRKVSVLFGGYTITKEGEYVKLNDTWEFDGMDWKQILTSNVPTPRHGVGFVFNYKKGNVLLFGGSTFPKSYGLETGETWEYNGENWQIVDVENVPENIFNSAMASGQEFILRFGGWNGEKRTNDTYIYSNENWEKLKLDLMPPARNHSRLIYNGESFILYGGHDGENIFGDMWEFSDSKWELLSENETKKRVQNNH